MSNIDSSKRFQRNYELVVRADGNDIVVRPPMQVAFTVDKSITGGLNKMNIQVTGLKESSRLAIVKDKEDQKRIPIVLRVGYKDNLETIFQGTVHRGSNDRGGSSFISTLECLDGGEDYLQGFTSKTIESKDVLVDEILKDMPNTKRGKVTDLPAITRPKVLLGNPIQVLRESLNADESLFIDNERLSVVKDGEVISSYAPIVRASTGLLNTPQKENQKITFETLMNPSLKLGGLADLRSVNAPYLNGVYKNESMTYTGDYEGSDWKQSVTAIAAKKYKVL